MSRRPSRTRLRAVLPPLLAAAVAGLSAPVAAQLSLERRAWVELEGLSTDFSRNTLQKPNDAAGDRFDALNFVGGRTAGLRLSVELPVRWWGEGHRLRLTYAPLSLDGTSAFASPVRFQDATFAPGTPTSLRYDFDTWRATYSVPLFGRTDPSTGWTLRVGGTLAVRDAQIRLSQAGVSQSFSNVGPVPLLHLSTSRALSQRWLLEGEFDAAPGPNGAGLFDGVARVRWAFSPDLSFSAGLRHLRGGVDNDELYNLVSSTSLTISARYAF